LSCVQPEEIPDTTTVNITIANNKQGVPYSKRLTFNYKEIYEKYINTGVLKYLKLWQNGNNASKGKAFLSRMIEGAIFANFSIFSKVYETLNSAASTPLAETLVIFILPMIFMYVYPLFIIVNMFLFVGFFFFNLSIFTKKRDPPQPQDTPMETKWIDYEPDEDGEWSTFGKFLLYLGGFFMMGIPLMLGSFLGMFMPIYSILYPLFATGKVKDQPYNFGNFLTDMLKFKKHMIMYYFSFNVILGAYNSGENGLATAITAFLAILFIWVFDKMFGVFTPYDWEKNDSKVMSVMTGNIPSQMPSKPAPAPVPGSKPAPVPGTVPVSDSGTGTGTVSDPNAKPLPEPSAPVKPNPDEGRNGEQIGLPQGVTDQTTVPETPFQNQPQQQVVDFPDAIAKPVPGSSAQLLGGVKRKEGMLGFAKRIFDTLVKEPLMGGPNQNGGNNKKSEKTKKTQ